MCYSIWLSYFWAISSRLRADTAIKLQGSVCIILFTLAISRVLMPISLSTWCNSRLSCSLETLAVDHSTGAAWPAAETGSLCKTTKTFKAPHYVQCVQRLCMMLYAKLLVQGWKKKKFIKSS